MCPVINLFTEWKLYTHNVKSVWYLYKFCTQESCKLLTSKWNSYPVTAHFICPLAPNFIYSCLQWCSNCHTSGADDTHLMAFLMQLWFKFQSPHLCHHQHYRLVSLALASLMTDALSLLSRTLVLHLFTSTFNSNLASSIHPNVGHFALSTCFAFQLLHYCTITIHSYMPKPFQSMYCNYRNDI